MKRPALMILVLGFVLFAQAAQAHWLPAKRITWTSGNSMAPAIAIDSSGTIHVVWHECTLASTEIYYKRSGDGGTTWSAAKRLTWTTNNAYPAIAIDSNDIIHLVWEDRSAGLGNGYDIYYRRSADGGTKWSAAKRLTWTTSSGNPVMVIDSSDMISVVWQESYGGLGQDYEIYCNSSKDGGTIWSAAKRLTWTSGVSAEPALAIGSGNAIHLIWEDDTPGDSEVYYKRGADGGAAWSAAKRLTWTSDSPRFSALAADSSNGVYVVWYGNTPENYEIYYKKSPDGGTTWNAAKRLTWTSGSSEHPAISIDSGNGIYVIWDDLTPGNKEIYYRRSADGSTTWTPVRRLTWTSGWSLMPAVAIDPSDTVHVIWEDDTPAPNNFEIYYLKGK